MTLAQGSTGLVDALTPREREVAERVAEGRSHKSVARELGVSPTTVRNHVANAAQKLPGDGRPSLKLARFAYLFPASDSV